jgi:shikimate dehydrogenase
MPSRLFGLIGYPLSHSFSKGYFTAKFEREGISDARYELFPLEDISQFPELVAEHDDLCGLNVTIPYKTAVIPYLDELEEEAKAIGAVNTILFTDGKSKGFNTDVFGFQESFSRKLQSHHQRALVLGTGGASKAVAYALKQLGISFQYVSRTASSEAIAYEQVTEAMLSEYHILINTTPLGMYPKVEELPSLPYTALSESHYLYDLVYNPSLTAFLEKGIAVGATTENGLDMLHLQAEKAWEIWNGNE